MYRGKSVAVVVPAYNEEKLIGHVIETMPDFVDWIVVVDDCSTDRTPTQVESYRAARPWNDRIFLIRHDENQGVGGAIASGYEWARDHKADVVVVMAGDAQMDPADLPAILDPVVEGRLDYAKGNRLFTGDAWEQIPRWRYLGNSALSLLTKIASGYWHVADSQSGYTAISLKVLETIDLDQIYRRYGMPNHFLVMLNIYNFRVGDVAVRPVYSIGEKSGIKPLSITLKLAWLLFKCFLWRMKEKYVIRDFHPLVFFYLMGVVLFVPGLLFGLYMVFYRLFFGTVATTSALFSVFLFVSGLQSLFFAMWFDMEYNRNLR
jgi:glycosyltransferase involved in cell wall biosynthesis